MDIHALIEQARDEMQRDGHLMPTIFLELSPSPKDPEQKNEYYLFALDVLSDTQSIPVQGGMLARLAWEHCKKHPGQHPVSVAMYAEGWVARSKEVKMVMDPSGDPDRVEMIIVQMWQAQKEPQVQCYMMSVVRSVTDNSITRIEKPVGPIPHASIQLESFLRGALDAQRPDEEVFGMMADTLKKSVGGLTQENREELAKILKHTGMSGHFEILKEILGEEKPEKQASPPLFQMPDVYPKGGPLYWRDEQSGLVPASLLAFLNKQPLISRQIEVIREYLRYYINAPCWQVAPHKQTEFESLKERVTSLNSAGEISHWLLECLKFGIDPL